RFAAFFSSLRTHKTVAYENSSEACNRVFGRWRRWPGRHGRGATCNHRSPPERIRFVTTAGRATDRAIEPVCSGEGGTFKVDCGATYERARVARPGPIERGASAAGRSGPHAS